MKSPPTFKTLVLTTIGAGLLHAAAAAQDDIPLLRPEERAAVEAQADEFNTSLAPALSDAAKSTVRIWSGKRRLAYGTVIGTNRVLTKWSEMARARGALSIVGSGGEVLAAKITGVYQDEDLAILETTGPPLQPVKWASENPVLGSFLAAPQPDGRPAAFGVVSVLERNLRDTDQAFIGIQAMPDFQGPGAKIAAIEPQSGAAAAGMKPGDVILKVGKRPISGLLELKNSLVGLPPGSTVTLEVLSGGQPRKLDVLLGNRPQLPDFPGDRLRQMERMGGAISRVRDSFPSAIQTDMRPQPNQIGGPVVDLEGQVIGITLARADRTRSFVMPAAAVQEVLQKPAQDPALARVRQPDESAALPVHKMPMPGRPQPGDGERMRRHLSEMRRLMEFMRDEMDSLEQSR